MLKKAIQSSVALNGKAISSPNINIAGTDISHAKVAKSRSPSQKKMLDKSLNATPQKRREIRHFLEDQKAEKSFRNVRARKI